MITRWNLDSFKSVYQDPQLPFAPLTLFAGVNSSGKSTIIQSILLAAQSLQNPVRARPLTLNGHILKLGTFADIHANGSESSDITIGFQLSGIGDPSANPQNVRSRVFHPWDYSDHESIERITCSFSFSPDETRERKEMVQLQPSLRNCTFSVEPTSESKRMTYEVRISTARETVPERVVQLQLKDLRMEELEALQFKASVEPVDYRSPYQAFYSKGIIIGAITYHFLPRAFLARFDEVEETTKRLVAMFINVRSASGASPSDDQLVAAFPPEFRGRIMEKIEQVASRAIASPLGYRIKVPLETLRQTFSFANYYNFARYLSNAERTALAEAVGEEQSALEKIARDGRPAIWRVRAQAFPQELDSAIEYVSFFFQNQIKYLAPLRDEPKPVYPLSGATDPMDIGFRGEHTASVLELNKSLEVDFIASANLERGLSERILDRATLGDAVLDWLRYFGVITNLVTRDLGELGHKLQVMTGGQGIFRDLTHVGVGVSQVLPIVVLSLLADRGSTLIFEQPELHLHPRVQSRLADFFLAMAALGKQCIVETHSEHMISKLRQRVASSEKLDLKDDIAMYFVETVDGKSKYSTISMNEFGTISNWPVGFFDEAEDLSASILEAAIQKRARLRQGQ